MSHRELDMAETPQPKQGSLWARIMGVADDPAPPALPGAIVPSDDPDDAVSFDSPADADDPSPTIKLANVMPPIPEFAKNPLEPELVALPAARRIPMATPIARPVEANAMHAAPITAVPIVSAPCPSCGTPRKPGHLFCDDCGYHFSPAATIPLATPIAVAAADAVPAAAVASIRLKDRYLLGAVIGEKLGVKRYRALDV
ncbi:MAG: zinc ribbon domain-containing protein, partial [Planctomycetota bacterium]